MFLISVSCIVLSIILIVLPQSFWNLIIKTMTGLIGSLITNNDTRSSIWVDVIKSKKRRYSTSALVLLLGLILLFLSMGTF